MSYKFSVPNVKVCGMCYIITIGTDTTFENLKGCVQRGLHVEKIQNAFFVKNMPKATSFVTLTEEMCSCGLFVQRGETTQNEINRKEEELRRKYKKKGYSENKIERIILDMNFTHKQKGEQDINADVDNLVLETLRGMLSQGTLLYLYCHMYSGGFDEEKLPLINVKSVSPDCLNSPIVTWLPEDTIVFIPKQFDHKAFSK